MTRWARDDDRGGEPEPGLYQIKLCKGGHHVACSIHRSEVGSWHAVIDGQSSRVVLDPYQCPNIVRIWHHAQRADAERHRVLIELKEWAQRHSPLHPILHPTRPIDTRKLPPIVPTARKVVP